MFSVNRRVRQLEAEAKLFALALIISSSFCFFFLFDTPVKKSKGETQREKPSSFAVSKCRGGRLVLRPLYWSAMTSRSIDRVCQSVCGSVGCAFHRVGVEKQVSRKQ